VIATLVFATAVYGEIDRAALDRLAGASSSDQSNGRELAQAWQAISSGGVEDIPVLLSALEETDPVAVNWIGSAIDRILERTGTFPPSESLVELILNVDEGNRARIMGLELLQESDPSAARQVTTRLLDDPVSELRSLAVDDLLATVDSESDQETRLEVYQRAYASARDAQQVATIAKSLRELGEEVDLIEKFGYLMHWRIIGPFDTEGGDGFDTVYPPESLNLTNYLGNEGIDGEVEYAGKSGAIRWRDFISSSRLGIVDLNKAIEELRGAVAYGAVVFESATDQEVEFRLRQQNAFKLWLNGNLLMAQPIGHTGNSFDQYRVPARLVAGPNLIVVKSCQPAEEVDHPFLKNWQIGVRVCDSTGAAVLAQNRPPTPALDPPSDAPAE
jgi:hypothetical protein